MRKRNGMYEDLTQGNTTQDGTGDGAPGTLLLGGDAQWHCLAFSVSTRAEHLTLSTTLGSFNPV